MILGVDQGTNNVGFAILNNDETIVFSGFINAKKEETDQLKLTKIHTKIQELLNSYEVNTIVCEQIFSSPMTANGALKTNLCTGLLYTLAIQHNKELVQILPNTIKKVITGNGRAKKAEMIKAVKEQKANIRNDHEADAICIATTYLKLQKKGDDEDGI